MSVYVSNLIKCTKTIDWPWAGFHLIVAQTVEEFRAFRARLKYRGAVCRRFGMMMSTIIPPCLYALACNHGGEPKTMAEIDTLMVQGLESVPEIPDGK